MTHDPVKPTDVSRETRDKLTTYAQLLTRWTQRINLVARSTLPELEQRHFADSAQLLDLVNPGVRSWIDLGSGGGFPGMVVAIVAEERMPALRVALVESDQRKCAFLQAVRRETGTDVTILPQRIEHVTPQPYDIVSARALAPLDRLIPLALPFCTDQTLCLFPKGRAAVSELTIAERRWRMEVDTHPSRVDPDGVVFAIRNIRARP